MKENTKALLKAIQDRREREVEDLLQQRWELVQQGASNDAQWEEWKVLNGEVALALQAEMDGMQSFLLQQRKQMKTAETYMRN